MSKFSLKFTLGLARFFFFPFYKFFLIIKKGLEKLAEPIMGRRQILFFLSLLAACILVAGETKALADNKYLGGRYSLLFAYLGPSEDEDSEIFEEVMPLNFPAADESAWNRGFLSISAPGSETANTEPIETASLTVNDTALFQPIVIPGAELGAGRSKIVQYVIQPGDTVGNLAQKFQISVETILIENKLSLRSILRPGDTLSILPVNGVSHKIKKGDNLKKIALLYKADIQKIIDFNHLTEEDLPIGEVLIVPEGKRILAPAVRSTQIAGSRPPALKVFGLGMLWPTTGRRITQYFSWRHTGIDIALPTGTPIYAALDGVVETSGWNRGGYGYQIILRHSNGLKTRYAHNSKLYVSVGQEVAKGDVIALMGSTGRSTGPHLHFEVIVGGVRVNPFLYVK